MDDKARKALVNSSGFPLQLRIESAVHETEGEHDLRVVASEHPWRDTSGAEGFIDLIIANAFFRLIVECKRTRGGEWIFLTPRGSEGKRRVARLSCHWRYRDGSVAFEQGDFALVPESPQAGFCVVRGSGEDQRPMLERLSAVVLKSVAALADQEAATAETLVYVPVIVTTATLRVCVFDANDVDLSTGQLSHCDFQETELVRFRKALSTGVLGTGEFQGLGERNKASQQTVLVVRAVRLAGLLKDFAVQRGASGKFPWEGQGFLTL